MEEPEEIVHEIPRGPPKDGFGGSILLDDAMIDDDDAICEIERVLPVAGPETLASVSDVPTGLATIRRVTVSHRRTDWPHKLG